VNVATRVVNRINHLESLLPALPARPLLPPPTHPENSPDPPLVSSRFFLPVGGFAIQLSLAFSFSWTVFSCSSFQYQIAHGLVVRFSSGPDFPWSGSECMRWQVLHRFFSVEGTRKKKEVIKVDINSLSSARLSLLSSLLQATPTKPLLAFLPPLHLRSPHTPMSSTLASAAKAIAVEAASPAPPSWFAHLPVPSSKPTQISVDELHLLLENEAAGQLARGVDWIVVDVRRADIEVSSDKLQGRMGRKR